VDYVDRPTTLLPERNDVVIWLDEMETWLNDNILLSIAIKEGNTINRKGHSYLCCSECLVGYHKVNDDDNDETPIPINSLSFG
jgi:hypothetical protein